MERKEFSLVITGSFTLVMLTIAILAGVFNDYITCIVTAALTLMSMFIFIYIHSLAKEEELKEQWDNTYYERHGIDLNDCPVMSVEEDPEELAKWEAERQTYIDERTIDLVEAFSILSNKRMNKQTRVKRLRKYIEKGIF